MQHRIHISGERVTGAVALTSHEPVIAAAKALLALGHPPSDQLSVIGPDVTFSPIAARQARRAPPADSALGRRLSASLGTPRTNFCATPALKQRRAVRQ